MTEQDSPACSDRHQQTHTKPAPAATLHKAPQRAGHERPGPGKEGQDMHDQGRQLEVRPVD
uniref:hypothetical protein n=1 Tax=Brachybacterium sp. GPGPB12 TaxID=3023517 RepID=UPI00404AE7BE